MAYSASGLHCIGGGSGQRLWYYSTADTIATVNTAGYFNDAANMLNLNDVISLSHRQAVHQLSVIHM